MLAAEACITGTGRQSRSAGKASEQLKKRTAAFCSKSSASSPSSGCQPAWGAMGGRAMSGVAMMGGAAVGGRATLGGRARVAAMAGAMAMAMGMQADRKAITVPVWAAGWRSGTPASSQPIRKPPRSQPPRSQPPRTQPRPGSPPESPKAGTRTRQPTWAYRHRPRHPQVPSCCRPAG